MKWSLNSRPLGELPSLTLREPVEEASALSPPPSTPEVQSHCLEPAGLFSVSCLHGQVQLGTQVCPSSSVRKACVSRSNFPPETRCSIEVPGLRSGVITLGHKCLQGAPLSDIDVGLCQEPHVSCRLQDVRMGETFCQDG